MSTQRRAPSRPRPYSLSRLRSTLPPPGAGPSDLDRELHRVFLILLRYLRGGRTIGARSHLDPLLDEMYRELSRVLNLHGPLHIRVAVDGLFRGESRILDYSPREDPAMFRLFRNGVRQLAFQPGLGRDELDAFVDALTADLTSLENVEEDVTTLLTSHDLASIQFVVVETFSESDDGDDAERRDKRAGDVAAIMAAALRQTISEQPEEALGGATGEGTIRFWAADVRFLESANIPSLLADLPRLAPGAGTSGFQDAELQHFARELEASVAQYAPWLPAAALAVLAQMQEKAEMQRLSAILAGELFQAAHTWGPGAVATPVRDVIAWLFEQQETEQADALGSIFFGRELSHLAIAGLREERGPGIQLGLDVLRLLPEDQIPGALRAVCELPEGVVRAAAIDALFQGGDAGMDVAAELIATLDGQSATTMLAPLRHAKPDPATARVFLAASAHPDARIRVRALSWFAWVGKEQAYVALGQALRDPSGLVRTGTMALLVEAHPSAARALLKMWFESDAFSDLEMSEKRLVALLLAELAGDGILPLMRGIVDRGGLSTRRQKADELRAAAIAALGLLVDQESYERLGPIADGKGAGAVAKAEAEHVLAAFQMGEHPYPPPREQLDERVRAFGILEAVEASRPDAALLEEISPSQLPPGLTSSLPPGVSNIFDAPTPVAGYTDLDALSAPRVPREVGAHSAESDLVDTREQTARVAVAAARSPADDETKTEPGTVPRESQLPAELVAELLGDYSFDTLPRMPGAGEGGEGGEGGEHG